MTLATAGYGSTFNWDGEDIAEITSISGPNITIDTIDATHYLSPSQFKEFIAGFADGGEVTLECNFIPGDTPGQVALIADAFAKLVKTAILTVGNPVMASWTFSGLITALAFAEPMDNKISFSVTIKISSVPVLDIVATADLTTLIGEDSAVGALVFTPAFLGSKYSYNIAVATGITWIRLKPELATSITTITQDTNNLSQTVASLAWSGTITLKAVLSITTVWLRVRTPGNIAKTYTLHIYRA